MPHLSKHVDANALAKRAERGAEQKELSRRTPHLHSLAYSSRFIADAVPMYELPEKSMSSKAAYQLIKDELELDKKPFQNMATFVSTWMEPEADKLMRENLGKNFVDKQEYPQTVEVQNWCVNVLGRLFNAPKNCSPVGTATVGSSEAFMLGALAMKFNWRKKMQQAGKPTDKPNIVFGNNAQVVLKKFAVYFDVEYRMVPVSPESRYVLDPKEAMKYVDENTICVVAILGSTFTGHFEDVKALSAELDCLQREKGIDVPIHVDAASGGFVAPFVFPRLEWDFRLERVKSINVSGHKYGLVYPGVGWVVWRDEACLPKELIFHLDYLGGDTPTYNLNFSRSSVHVLGQFYNFIRLGREGYTDVIQKCMTSARFFAAFIESCGYFTIRSEISKPDGLAVPVVSFSLKESYDTFDEYDIMRSLQENGWIVPAYKLPPSCETTTILRVVVREIHNEEMLEKLGKDLIQAVEELRGREERFAAKRITKEEKKANVDELRATGRRSTTFSSLC